MVPLHSTVSHGIPWFLLHLEVDKSTYFSMIWEAFSALKTTNRNGPLYKWIYFGYESRCKIQQKSWCLSEHTCYILMILKFSHIHIHTQATRRKKSQLAKPVIQDIKSHFRKVYFKRQSYLKCHTCHDTSISWNSLNVIHGGRRTDLLLFHHQRCATITIILWYIFYVQTSFSS
jgi:hypothetical protein